MRRAILKTYTVRIDMSKNFKKKNLRRRKIPMRN